MALPILTNLLRYRKYGRTAEAVESQLVSVTLFGVENVRIHKKAVDVFKRWEASVRAYEDEVIVGVGGIRRKRVKHPWQPRVIQSWNWRLKRGSSSRSMHSWGIAVDIDPAQNPMGKPLRTNIPAYVTNRAKLRGLRWGGDWRTPDAMHFEWPR
jgi:hypothetical protein